MEINREMLKKLASLPDDELKEKILSIAERAGVPGDRAEKKLTDIPAIKKKLMNITDGEIRLLMLALGDKNAALLKEKLNNGGNEG